ncbi:hypothetical protein EVAR_18837_1 [Eumeta japonica]|uniref:Protein G12 n=1 Tax=Eumeta variegata TaxID=151549 RepID=A0A4C1ULP4_EUMVA|nr:hypothetical protein EVAR_18837_1 [Eumeta japonica]
MIACSNNVFSNFIYAVVTRPGPLILSGRKDGGRDGDAICASASASRKGYVRHKRDIEILLASTPTLERYVEVEKFQEKPLDKWSQHILDFGQFLDFSAVFSVVSKHIEDDEVKAFLVFLFSAEFEILVNEFESLEEFHEIVAYFNKKGYDVVPLINTINPFLNIPPYSLPRRIMRNTGDLANFIVDLFNVLPTKQWMDLFDKKLQNDLEFKQFIETISSPEFLAITERLSYNAKFQSIKQVFQSKGLNAKLLCEVTNKLIGSAMLCK